MQVPLQLPGHGTSGTIRGNGHRCMNIVVLLADNYRPTQSGPYVDNAALIHSAPGAVHVHQPHSDALDTCRETAQSEMKPTPYTFAKVGCEFNSSGA
jgi:hypothetical protein